MRRAFGRHIVLLGLASYVAAHSFHEVFERASTCADPASASCNITSVPSNFCCPRTSTCIPLAANTTLLCCPAGETCDSIQAVDCNITLQDVGANNQLMTTALTSTLPTCGSLCCPFGYTCNSNTICMKDANQSIAPGVSSSNPSATATSSTITPSTTEPTSTGSTSPATSLPLDCSPTLVKQCDKFPVVAILVGFFPGLVLGIVLTLGSICILGLKRGKSFRRRSGSSFGNISEPVPIEHMRTDFLRKPAQTPSSTGGFPGGQTPMHRVRSMFRKSQVNNSNEMQQSPRPPMPLVIKKNPQTQYPVTPPLQRQRSYEDVNIFAGKDVTNSSDTNQRQNNLKPSMADPRSSHLTTMDDIIAGLPKGQPYIYRPAYTPTPKTRGS